MHRIVTEMFCGVFTFEEGQASSEKKQQERQGLEQDNKVCP
jgi:hypothetical protein